MDANDAYLVALATEAGTVVVGLLVNEGWQQVRDELVDVWRRHRSQSADDVERELESSRRVLLADSGDTATAERQAGGWRQRFADLLAEHPAAAEDLRTLVARSGSAPGGQNIQGGVRLDAHGVSGGRVYQSAGAQYIIER
jgi:hypothetical protein